MLKPETKDRTPWAHLPEPADEGHGDRQCIACGSVAPAASAHTLISAKHGWRLRRAGEIGSARMEWFCPNCWAARRGAVEERPRHPSGPYPTPSQAPAVEIAHAPSTVDVRSTAGVDMTASICALLATKLRSRATPGPNVNRILRAIEELQLEAETWSTQPGTPERRKEIWAELRALDAQAEGLLDK